MALALRLDPYLGFRFLVEIQGLIVAGFSEVGGLQAEIETFEYREGGLNDYAHHLPGPVRYPNLVNLPDDTTLITNGARDYRGRGTTDNHLARIYHPDTNTLSVAALIEALARAAGQVVQAVGEGGAHDVVAEVAAFAQRQQAEHGQRAPGRLTDEHDRGVAEAGPALAPHPRDGQRVAGVVREVPGIRLHARVRTTAEARVLAGVPYLDGILLRPHPTDLRSVLTEVIPSLADITPTPTRPALSEKLRERLAVPRRIEPDIRDHDLAFPALAKESA